MSLEPLVYFIFTVTLIERVQLLRRRRMIDRFTLESVNRLLLLRCQIVRAESHVGSTQFLQCFNQIVSRTRRTGRRIVKLMGESGGQFSERHQLVLLLIERG